MTPPSSIITVLPKIIEQLGIRHRFCGDYYQCQCPLHQSTKFNSMTIFKDGGWQCWTSNCNEQWGSNIYGLIKGLGADPNQLLAGVNYSVQYKEEEIDLNLPVLNMSRDEVRDRLMIPSPYYLERGFSEKLLDKFDVGDSSVKQMKNRAVFPIYNKDYELIGCAGRTTMNKSYIQKWKYSNGFKSSRTFFCMNHAYESMMDTKTIVLVEGQSDTMVLQDAGIKNCVGAFGAKLSRGQTMLLKELGIENIVIALDPDESKERDGKIIEGTGPMRTRQILKRWGEDFNFVPVKLNSDPDEMSQSEIERVFGSYV
jgi:hypothetical protein